MHSTYWKNGLINIEYYQIINKKNGIYKQYYHTGQLQEEHNYVDDVLHGSFITYDSNGNITS